MSYENMNMNMNFQNPGFNNFNNYNNNNRMWGNTMLPRYEIVQVNGENGANAFQMGPNSKTLLLDESAPIVWFVQTDGAGYKTVTPYSISPYQAAPKIDLNALEARITSLEEKINAKSNSGTGKNSKRNASDSE